MTPAEDPGVSGGGQVPADDEEIPTGEEFMKAFFTPELLGPGED